MNGIMEWNGNGMEWIESGLNESNGMVMMVGME